MNYYVLSMIIVQFNVNFNKSAYKYVQFVHMMCGEIPRMLLQKDCNYLLDIY